jgi:hypothetical protein
MNKPFETDIRTPFYDERDRQWIAGRLEETIGHSEFPEMEAIDGKELDNLGTQSIRAAYPDRIDSVEEYMTQFCDFDRESFDYARRRLFSLLPNGSIRPWTIRNAAESAPSHTYTGLHRCVSSDEYFDEYLERAERATDPEDIYPSVLGARVTANGTNKPKVRVVFMADKAQVFLDLTVERPLLEAIRKLPGFTPWIGQDAVDEEITRILRKAEQLQVPVYSLDQSHFDASVPRELLDVVRDAMYHYCPSDKLDLIMEVFATVGLVCPDREWGPRNGGVPSGSGLTNMVDSLINLFAGWYCAYRLEVELIDYSIQGDDAVFLFSQAVDPQDLADAMLELGLTTNAEKQFISERSAHFLQRWHSLDYMPDGIAHGVHSPYRSLVGLTGLERYINDRDVNIRYLMTARAIMIVENLRHHWAFEAIVKEFMVGGDDVFQEDIDPVDIVRLAGGAEAIDRATNRSSFPFNVQDPRGIELMKTTQILRSLR